MIGPVLEFTDLQRLSGYNRLADVQRWADRIGLRVKPCRDGLASSVEAWNEALGVRPTAANDDSHHLPDVV